MCDFVLSFGKPAAQERNRLNLPMRGVVVFLKPHRVMLVSNPTYNAGCWGCFASQHHQQICHHRLIRWLFWWFLKSSQAIPAVSPTYNAGGVALLKHACMGNANAKLSTRSMGWGVKQDSECSIVQNPYKMVFVGFLHLCRARAQPLKPTMRGWWCFLTHWLCPGSHLATIKYLNIFKVAFFAPASNSPVKGVFLAPACNAPVKRPFPQHFVYYFFGF